MTGKIKNVSPRGYFFITTEDGAEWFAHANYPDRQIALERLTPRR